MNVDCNMPASCVLLVIYHISVLIYSFLHIIIYLFYIVSTNHMHFKEVLYVNANEEISFSKVYI
jgi:hypothetical protein